ncbi:eukaryotic translation initiation factor 4B isoform X6 [Pleurodeles waltl]|uniref:eukaryotic translation initiation factor 4B isoform X6 n=1 Tax=Pleurodeles waltl TaxID=8319 RepID=UPI0037096853
MAASAKKKGKKGKTLTLTDFLADDTTGGSSGGGGIGGHDRGGSSFDRGGSSFDRGGSSFDRGGSSFDRGGSSFDRGGSSFDRGGSSFDRGGYDRGGSSYDRGGGSSYSSKPVSWADETDDLEGDVSTTWHSNDDDAYRTPAIDRSILPTAPRAAREPDVDRSRLPKSPPFTAFLGNLPYDVCEESILKFFHGLNISAVRLPREPSNPERLKGFGYAEFDDLDSLLRALSLNEESLGNRRIRVDVADQSNDKDRDGSFGGRDRDRNRDSDKTDSSDWRARPTSDTADDPPRRGDDGFGDRFKSDRYESDRYRDGPRRDGFDRAPRDRYDDRDRREGGGGFDDSRGSRRAFGTGYRQDYEKRDDYRGGGDRYGDRSERRDDRDRWTDSSRDDFRREERDGSDAGPTQRPKLVLKPRTAPKEPDSSGGSTASSRAASIFGAAKPVDTAAREREVEERLQKEQEKLTRHLDDERPRLERKPRERHPSWRSEENTQERSRTGSESSQTGSTGTSSRSTRRRESEKSVENEVFSKDEESTSPSSKGPKAESPLPLKVMPAPPPKENAWVKRSTTSPAARSLSSDSDKQSPTSGVTEPGLPKSSPKRADENKLDGLRSPQGKRDGNGRSWGDGQSRESERNDCMRERDFGPSAEPNRLQDVPGEKFSHASKYAALAVDGEDDEGFPE